MGSENSFLESYYLNDKASDVTICATTSNGVCLKIPSHRFVLSGVSPVFEKMLEQDKFQEGTSSLVNIKIEGDEDVARLFIRFFYFGKVQNEDLTQAVGLLKTSHLYKVERLIARSEEMVLGALTPNNVCQIYEETVSLGSKAYTEKIVDFVLRSAFIIFQEEKHLCLPETVMDVILSSDFLNIIHENQAVDALWEWGRWSCLKSGSSVSPSAIAMKIKNLFRHVRWSQVTNRDSYEEEETSQVLDTETRGPNRKTNSYTSLLKFADVFEFNEEAVEACEPVDAFAFRYDGLVSFRTYRDIYLIGFELHLEVNKLSVGKTFEFVTLTLDNTVIDLLERKVVRLGEKTSTAEKFNIFLVRFESVTPVPLKRMKNHALEIKSKRSVGKSFQLPLYGSSNSNIIIENRIVSAQKIFYFPAKSFRR